MKIGMGKCGVNGRPSDEEHGVFGRIVRLDFAHAEESKSTREVSGTRRPTSPRRRSKVSQKVQLKRV